MTGPLVRHQGSAQGPTTVKSAARRRLVDFTFLYLAVLGCGMLVAGFAWMRSWQPYIGLSTAILLMTWTAWTVNVRLGLYLTVFLTLVSDGSTVSWWPFNKNLSTPESIFWISDGFSMSPLELTLIFGLLAVAFRRWGQNRPLFDGGVLQWPFAVLVVAIAWGFVNGVATGGDLRIATFEVRPLLYFPIVYLLATSVCDHAKHYRHLLFSALAAIGVQSVFSAHFATGLSAAQRASLESLTEHGSSVGINLLLMCLILSLAVRGCSWALRTALFVASLPAIWVYLLSQRRVAFVSLVLAGILFSIILFWRQRRTFWKLIPILAVIGLGYVGAFWNVESAVGFPAQAVKTVIAPDELSAKDQSSDEYRLIENFNLQATIKASPVRGIGFGQPFFRPIPLPDISAFEFHEYIPHNSLLWVWIKTGLFGMMALLYVLARTIVGGVDRVRRQRLGIDFLISTAGLLFVAMFAMYIFADIAWEPRNSVLFGVCIALCVSGVGLPPTKAVSGRSTWLRKERSGTWENQSSGAQSAQLVNSG